MSSTAAAQLHAASSGFSGLPEAPHLMQGESEGGTAAHDTDTEEPVDNVGPRLRYALQRTVLIHVRLHKKGVLRPGKIASCKGTSSILDCLLV